MSKCGYMWNAPFLLRDAPTRMVPQTCVLKKGHLGNHRSITKVIATNERDYEETVDDPRAGRV